MNWDAETSASQRFSQNIKYYYDKKNIVNILSPSVNPLARKLLPYHPLLGHTHTGFLCISSLNLMPSQTFTHFTHKDVLLKYSIWEYAFLPLPLGYV